MRVGKGEGYAARVRKLPVAVSGFLPGPVPADIVRPQSSAVAEDAGFKGRRHLGQVCHIIRAWLGGLLVHPAGKLTPPHLRPEWIHDGVGVDARSHLNVVENEGRLRRREDRIACRVVDIAYRKRVRIAVGQAVTQAQHYLTLVWKQHGAGRTLPRQIVGVRQRRNNVVRGDGGIQRAELFTELRPHRSGAHWLGRHKLRRGGIRKLDEPYVVEDDVVVGVVERCARAPSTEGDPDELSVEHRGAEVCERDFVACPLAEGYVYGHLFVSPLPGLLGEPNPNRRSFRRYAPRVELYVGVAGGVEAGGTVYGHKFPGAADYIKVLL